MGYPEVTESMLVKGMKELRAVYWGEKFLGEGDYLDLVNLIPWTDANHLSYAPAASTTMQTFRRRK